MRPWDIIVARQESLDQRTFVLSPSARILNRPGHRIQFGCDAFSAGIMDVNPDIYESVFEVLHSCSNQQTGLATQLTDAGLDDLAAQSLIADLTTYGILREVGPKPAVAVVGRSAATDMVRDILARSGITVRSPLRNETDSYLINRIESHVPIVLMDYLHHIDHLAPFLYRRPNVIPAALYDNTAVVGPVRIGGKGPCIKCASEYERGKDEHWNTVLEDYFPPKSDPIAAATLAAHVAAAASAMVGIHPGAGNSPFQLSPGAVVKADPFAMTVAHTVMETHPLCHYCHAILTEDAEWKELTATDSSA